MRKIFFAFLITAFTFMGASAHAETVSRDEIEAIIKDYIQNNPEVILESVENYGRQQQAADAQDRQERVERHLSWLEDNEMLPVAGNPEGDITVVEFFDYNCGYCKKALDDVLTIMGEDKGVKFIFVETPILGRTSELAAKWALAAKMQDKYLEYHIALMKNRGPLNEAALIRAAEKTGLDIEQMKTDAESDVVANKVAEKSLKASQMGISGTPAFIIDGQLYGGYIGADRMREAIAEARANQ
jgi:protein-disulfide isomerase